MLVVTNEMGFAREAGSRLIFMDGGHILEEGDSREVLANPPRTSARGTSSPACSEPVICPGSPPPGGGRRRIAANDVCEVCEGGEL